MINKAIRTELIFYNDIFENLCHLQQRLGSISGKKINRSHLIRIVIFLLSNLKSEKLDNLIVKNKDISSVKKRGVNIVRCKVFLSEEVFDLLNEIINNIKSPFPIKCSGLIRFGVFYLTNFTNEELDLIYSKYGNLKLN